ncbi:hypothetical protein MSTHT_2036 [Methanosarcina thermophila TM-1]|uniref:Uncharacterized protein n=1 Tax=Methanosarcina thermophila (strain ATCC 43570 / DSM 1825 / OCM 12 / VKM B-1830 / TM-1) TaxID=523844 RepID=A0A0E3H9B1_METTT|nr:hypothetical protein MSTHT_2036 [Methanosarcina thermophila TM-1]
MKASSYPQTILFLRVYYLYYMNKYACTDIVHSTFSGIPKIVPQSNYILTSIIVVEFYSGFSYSGFFSYLALVTLASSVI